MQLHLMLQKLLNLFFNGDKGDDSLIGSTGLDTIRGGQR